MAFIRLPLILLVSGAIILAFRLAGQPAGLGTVAVFCTLSVTLANIVCLGLHLWRSRVEGFELRPIVGFQRRRLLRNLAIGVLWSMVLFALPWVGAFAVLTAIQRISGLPFEQVFMGDTDFSFEPGPWLTVIYAAIAALAFSILNPLVEELQYRGCAQSRLIAASGTAWLGILIPALGFGLQHIAFAYTVSSAPAYAVSFLLWGVGAGIIAHRQKRLMPITIAHFISNLPFGLIPLFFIVSGA
jgi:membrane protease YdiL (CAAX protease family)